MKRCLLTLMLAGCGADYVADDFSYSDEGWTLETLSNEPQMSLTKSSSYTGPNICGSDHGFSGATEFWRFRAPDKYLGNASHLFGRRLTWDSQTDRGRNFLANDLFLGGRGITLVVRVPNTPNRTTSWAGFTVHLDTKSPWTVVETNALATEDDIKSVLANVTTLRLPGEWVDGEETTCIDNVFFGTP